MLLWNVYQSYCFFFQQVNALNKGTEDNITEHVPVPRFESLKPWDETLRTKPDLQFYIAYDFYRLNNPHFHKFPEYGFYNGKWDD